MGERASGLITTRSVTGRKYLEPNLYDEPDDKRITIEPSQERGQPLPRHGQTGWGSFNCVWRNTATDFKSCADDGMTRTHPTARNNGGVLIGIDAIEHGRGLHPVGAAAGAASTMWSQ
jgi:hypothetical protein